MALSSVAIVRQRQSALANEGNLNVNVPLFDLEQFRRIAFKSIPFLVGAIFIISVIEGGLSTRNIMGIIISGMIISYLIHFILISEI